MPDLTPLGLSSQAADAYRALLHGQDSAKTEGAASELEAAGLVHRGRDGSVLPNSPRRAVERWARQEESRIRQVREAAEQWETLFRSLAGKEITAEVVTGVPAVAAAFADVQSAATEQIRCTDRGPYLPTRERSPGPAQLAALGAGVAYRVIYDDVAFQQADLREEIYGAIAAGEQSRVLAGVPAKMLIADDTLGIVAHPRPGGEPEVVIIERGLLLESLTESFELLWRLAIEVAVPSCGAAAAAQEPTDETRALLRGLAAGLTDESIGRELGMSERTVHRRIRRLQDLLASRSRFQLGIQAVRRG